MNEHTMKRNSPCKRNGNLNQHSTELVKMLSSVYRIDDIDTAIIFLSKLNESIDAIQDASFNEKKAK
jgi:hypothetical protein